MKTFRNLKRLFFALIIPGMFFVGILLGYQLHEEGVAHGCFPLKEDLSIAPIQTEKKGVVKFGVIGDTGTANLDQQEVANSLAKICRKDGCDLVLMLGDNFYSEGLKTLEDPLFTKGFLEIYRELEVPFFPFWGTMMSKVIFRLSFIKAGSTVSGVCRITVILLKQDRFVFTPSIQTVI